MNYRDATEDESRRVLDAAKKLIGTDYMKVGQCTGLVCQAIRAVNIHFPVNGPVSVISANQGLRALGANETPRAGDVMVWRGTHMGIYDPNPPANVARAYTVLSARGTPGGKNNAGVSYGLPSWFHPGAPVYMRVMVPA